MSTRWHNDFLKSVLRVVPSPYPGNQYANNDFLKNEAGQFLKLDPDTFTLSVLGTTMLDMDIFNTREGWWGRIRWYGGWTSPMPYTTPNAHEYLNLTANGGFASTAAASWVNDDGGGEIGDTSFYLNRRAADVWQISLQGIPATYYGQQTAVGWYWVQETPGPDPRGNYVLDVATGEEQHDGHMLVFSWCDGLRIT